MAFWTASTSQTMVKKLKEKGCLVSFSIEVPYKKFTDGMQNALIQIQSKVSIPGFRVGKAPLQMVKNQFQDQIKERALDKLFQSVLPDVIKEQGIVPVSPPVIKTFNCKEDKPVSFEVEIECAPKFEAKNYTRAVVAKKSSAVTDEDIEKSIRELLEHNACLESLETAVVGKEHFAVVDYEATSDGKKIAGGSGKGELVDMSSPQTVAGLAENILGAKKGETKEFDSESSGRRMHFKVTVNEIKKKVVPELNDAFVKGMGFESVDRFKAHLKDVMGKDAAEKSERDILRQIEDHLVKENPIPVPESLVKTHLDLTTERIKERFPADEKDKWDSAQEEKLKTQLRPAVERDIRLSYVLRSIAQKEKLEAKDIDFEAELEKTVNTATDEKQKSQVRKTFETRREDIMAALTEKKVVQFLKSKASIT